MHYQVKQDHSQLRKKPYTPGIESLPGGGGEGGGGEGGGGEGGTARKRGCIIRLSRITHSSGKSHTLQE
jgi:hypothetical protein